MAAAALIPVPGGAPPDSAPARRAFADLPGWISGASRVIVAGADGAVTLTRAVKPGTALDQGWVLAEKGGYPVQRDAIGPVLTGFEHLRLVAPRTARPALYPRLGVEDPGGKGAGSHQITLADPAHGDAIGLIVGKRRDDPGGGDGGIYVRRPGDAQSWLAKPAFDLPADALSWIDRSVVDIDPGRIRGLTLTPAAGPALVFARDKAADKLVVGNLPSGAKLKSDEAGATAAGNLQGLTLDDVAPASTLAVPPAATVDAETFDGLTLKLTLIPSGGKTWAILSASGTAKDAAAISARTAGWAYSIPDDRAKGLEVKLADIADLPAPPVPRPARAKKPRH